MASATLDPGTRLGPYEIVGPLGAGGMGEVYRAKDTRLDRTVAIKVLPALLAADPQFRERFGREARVVSQLNHPNICTLHDVGEQDGTAFLVMELLEGETLAERISKGAFPLDQVLECALQIADALDKAHRLGIVHRDLKPANVMLVRGANPGAVNCKLLDFGLARIGSTATAGSIETRMLTTPMPSAGAPLTTQGSILGTFQYMAPEQIEGQEADARADIWAFGCVLYEMATGRRPFEGKTHASLIASILEREPRPLAELQPMTPPALDRVVRTCLAKDPNERFQTAHDLRLQLRWIQEGGSAAGLPAPVIARRRHHERALWLGVTAAVGLVGAGVAWWLKPAPPVPAIVSRLEFALPEDQTLTRPGRRVLDISPDGTKIVYVANQQLYLRALNELTAQPIRGTAQDPLDPVFSPDGEWIAYFAPVNPGTRQFALRKVPVAGGAPVTLAQTDWPYGASWQNGTIAYGQNVPGKHGTIEIVSDAGGPPTTLVSIDTKDAYITQPHLLDGRPEVLFAVVPRSRGGGDGQILAYASDRNSRVVVASGGMNPRLLAGGQLVYFHDSTLIAVPFDEDRLTVTGGPVPVIEGVSGSLGSFTGQFAISRNGTLVYAPGSMAGESERRLVWVDRQGREAPIAAKPRAYEYPRLSPDGTRIAVGVNEDEYDIWVWDLAKDTLSRLTFGEPADTYPTWTPDSRQIIFSSRATRETNGDLFRRSADGTGAAIPLTKDNSGGVPQAISADGTRIVIRDRLVAPWDLTLLSLDGGIQKPLLADTAFSELNAAISPDGRWITYQSDESGSSEVYVRPFPAVDSGRWQISTGGGTRPAWSHSGRELFFLAASGGDLSRLEMIAVPVLPGASFSHGKPQSLFRARQFALGPAGRNYDVAADGRFLMLKTGDEATFTRHVVFVVSNWSDEVKTRVK